MRFTKREDYGMILMGALFDNFGERLTPLSEIAQKYKIPLLFLRNIAQDLRRGGFIAAAEGRNGGYKLAQDPKKIKFGNIIETLSRKPLFSCCQETPDGKCKVASCPHGFSLRRLNNEFLGNIYNRSLKEILENA